MASPRKSGPKESQPRTGKSRRNACVDTRTPPIQAFQRVAIKRAWAAAADPALNVFERYDALLDDTFLRPRKRNQAAIREYGLPKAMHFAGLNIEKTEDYDLAKIKGFSKRAFVRAAYFISREAFREAVLESARQYNRAQYIRSRAYLEKAMHYGATCFYTQGQLLYPERFTRAGLNEAQQKLPPHKIDRRLPGAFAILDAQIAHGATKALCVARYKNPEILFLIGPNRKPSWPKMRALETLRLRVARFFPPLRTPFDPFMRSPKP